MHVDVIAGDRAIEVAPAGNGAEVTAFAEKGRAELVVPDPAPWSPT